MNYRPLSVIYITDDEADILGATVIDPQWGVGNHGWYMTDEDGVEVFGPFETVEDAHSELYQYLDDMDQEDGLRSAFGR